MLFFYLTFAGGMPTLKFVTWWTFAGGTPTLKFVIWWYNENKG